MTVLSAYDITVHAGSTIEKESIAPIPVVSMCNQVYEVYRR